MESFNAQGSSSRGCPTLENDTDTCRSPSPPTHSWPLSTNFRSQIRSCIEFSPAASPRTPMSESHLNFGNLQTHVPVRRVSNPFLLDFTLDGEDLDEDDFEDGGEFADGGDFSTSHSLSLSLLSNDEEEIEEQDGDEDDTLSSNGNLSEVFEALSRFSEVCLASAEALCSPVEACGGNTLTPRANYSLADLNFSAAAATTSNKSYDNDFYLVQSISYDRLGDFPISYPKTPQQPSTSSGQSALQRESSLSKCHQLSSSVPVASGSAITYNSSVSDTTSDCNLAAIEESSILTLLTLTPTAPLPPSFDWEGRCADLEVALQKFGEQAGRVRLCLRHKLAEYERRVVEAEQRADEAEDKVRMMEQQLSDASTSTTQLSKSAASNNGSPANAGAITNGGTSWTNGLPDPSDGVLSTLQNAVREKERVISRLECQVEEQRLLRLQESRQVEEKAAKIKEWVSNKLRDLEGQNEHLREQNQKCESQLDLLRSRLTQLSQLSTISSKNKDRHSTEDSSRGSYEGDRLPSDESPPPDGSEGQVTSHQEAVTPRPISATAACLAAIRRRSGAFDTPEERLQRRRSNNMSTSGGSLTQQRVSRDSRSSRVDSGSVDMETPQSLSPRSPLNTLEVLEGGPLPTVVPNGITQSSSSCSVLPSLPPHLNLNVTNNNNNNNNIVINNASPDVHPVPAPIPVSLPTQLFITHSPSPATPLEVIMIGGTDSTQSLTELPQRRIPTVPPRRCRTRSPTPNTSKGTTPGSDSAGSPPTESEEDPSLLRARLDAECQQLARDLQAAVRELVRPELSFGSSSQDHAGQALPLKNGIWSTKGVARDESHDYSEIYTPSLEEKITLGNHTSQPPPPPPPIHRFPSWESRIYEVAAGGLKVPFNSEGSEVHLTGSRHRSYHSLGINFSIPVYTTVKGRASQIRSTPFSGDTSDSSDGEEGGSGSGSGPHPVSSGETDLSSPGKSVASSLANSLSPHHRSSSSPSKSIRREPSFESEISDDYALPPDAFASETSSLDIALSAGCRNITPSSAQISSSSGHINSVESSPRKESLEKSGFLTKLGGKFKTWRKRWFVLKNGSLTYWKSPQDVHRRSTGREIVLDELCHILRGDGAATFEIATGKKTYYLTADSTTAVDDWVRVLQNVVRRNATKLVLSMEENKPTMQGWLIKVKNGHAKRSWCVLIGKMFLTFKSPVDVVPSGQINMRDARVEDVDHISDSENDDDKDDESGVELGVNSALTIGIFPSHQSPVYLHMPTKQDKDSWLYHLTIVSGKGPSAGTQFEQLIHKLMEVDGDPNSTLWKNPLLLHSKESITSPLTSLSSEPLQNEAIKLFKSCQLFMSVPLDSSGIDYHVALAQNALQLCLDYQELQAELICALVKQTSRTLNHKNSPHTNRALNKIKHSRHFLLNATQSLFLCDSSSGGHSKVNQNASNSNGGSPSHGGLGSGLGRSNGSTGNKGPASPSRPPRAGGGSNRTSPAKTSKGTTKASSSSVPSSPLLSHNHGLVHHHSLSSSDSKSSIRSFVFIQGWQLLSLAVSLFLPKNNKLLWYLKQHLLRHVDMKSESGKYAAYCQRSIERSLENGPRLYRPSRMEVLSILIKNPFHHSHPHSVPVHFLSGGYQVVNFDGSSTVSEFLLSLCHTIGCRDPFQSGFALFEDDPFEKDLEHSLVGNEKICDVISQWETMLREKGSGRFETRRAATLSFKLRLYRRAAILQETDKEKLLLCYQTNQAVVSGRFPLTRELALELATLLAQIDSGDYKKEKGRGSTGSQLVVQAMEKYYPLRYRENLSVEEYKTLCDNLTEKWTSLKGKSTLDCVRIYLTCTRKWGFFGATLFSVHVRGTQTMEDGTNVWAAISEDGIGILDIITLQQIGRYSFGSIQTFGGALDDHFMFVVDDMGKKRRILFGGMSKLKVLEMTRLVADFINASSPNSILSGNGRVTRHSSLKSSRLQSTPTLPPATPRLDRKYLGGHDTPVSSICRSPHPIQRCDSLQSRHSPKP